MSNLYDILKASKGIIIATLVYNGGVSAQLKAVMDRYSALFAADPNALRGKVGMAIAGG